MKEIKRENIPYEIREIWQEMKELNILRQEPAVLKNDRRDYLEKKYEDTEINFGQESTLSKAIIFYLDFLKH